MWRTWTCNSALLLLAFASVSVGSGLDGKEMDALLYGEAKLADAAIERLRAAGPAALESLLAKKQEISEEAIRKAHTNMPPDISRVLKRLDDAIDWVGGAKYCTASRLYWYTDIEQAKTAAQRCGKPILTLRMLGNLTDEFSCANSRFFRTTLYANEEVSKVLRERFVLHWKSVRPVPKVTIDFGDGRKLERTITGNSIHYILTPDGQVVDAIPGLYGPKAFVRHITRGEGLARLVAELSHERRGAMLADFHKQQAEEVAKAWEADWQKAQVALFGPARLSSAAVREKLENFPAQSRSGELKSQYDPPGSQPAAQTAAPPRAEAATRIAVPKMAVEAKVVEAVNLTKIAPENLQDETAWNFIAALHAEQARLDDSSRNLMRTQNPTAAAAGARATGKRQVEDPMLKLFAAFETSVALDSVKNEYQFHRRIHEWLASADYRPDVETLNERVYAELFLTPSSDPWLGLAPADVYTALPNGGVGDGGGR